MYILRFAVCKTIGFPHMKGYFHTHNSQWILKLYIILSWFPDLENFIVNDIQKHVIIKTCVLAYQISINVQRFKLWISI